MERIFCLRTSSVCIHFKIMFCGHVTDKCIGLRFCNQFLLNTCKRWIMTIRFNDNLSFNIGKFKRCHKLSVFSSGRRNMEPVGFIASVIDDPARIGTLPYGRCLFRDIIIPGISIRIKRISESAPQERSPPMNHFGIPAFNTRKTPLKTHKAYQENKNSPFHVFFYIVLVFSVQYSVRTLNTEH